MTKKLLWIFFISMLPIVEIRGAMVYASANNVPLLWGMLIGILGNMLPVPFIFYLARKFLTWGKDQRYISKICVFFLERGAAAGRKLTEKAGYGLNVALFVFVAIPLPGTGAWTGTFAASLLDMDFKKSVIAVMGGVVVAGLLIYAASIGLISAWFAITT